MSMFAAFSMTRGTWTSAEVPSAGPDQIGAAASFFCATLYNYNHRIFAKTGSGQTLESWHKGVSAGTGVSPWVGMKHAGNNTVFLSHLCIKMMILPRQALGTNKRGNHSKKDRFVAAALKSLLVWNDPRDDMPLWIGVQNALC
jgi:hypothetical protein